MRAGPVATVRHFENYRWTMRSTGATVTQMALWQIFLFPVFSGIYLP